MNNTRKNRGQATMEYLATYGWAVLIIVVIGVVIWQSGVLSVGKSIPPGKSGFSQVRPLDWKAQASGTTEVTVVNNAGTKVTLTGVSSTYCTGGSASGDLLPGQSTPLTLTGCSFIGNVGESYKMDLTISYSNPSSGLDHASVGTIWGSLE